MTESIPSRRSARHARPRHLMSLERSPGPWQIAGFAVLNVFLPGTPRFLRMSGRWRWFFLVAPVVLWAMGTYTVLSALASRAWAFELVTHPSRSFFLILGLIVLSLWYLITYLDLFGIFRFRSRAPRDKVLIAVLLAPLMLLTTGGTAYAADMVNIGRNALGDIFVGSSRSDTGTNSGSPFLQPVDGRYNFLVMGGDAGADRVGRRPDSIMVVSVDAQTGQAATISIPRNFQNAPFPASSPMRKIYPEGYDCGDKCIINSLYTEVTQQYQDLYPGKKDPGAQAMMDAASGILGLTIQAYVIVDMDNFSQLVDLMGGVKINAGGWVPMSGAALDNNGRHLPPVGWIAPGVQTLNGYQALWYARSREYTLDYARSQRQQCVVQAMVKQMDPATVLTKFDAIVNAGSQVIESDLPQQQLASFIDLAIKAKSHPLARLTLGPPDFGRDFPTYPDFNAVQRRVKELFSTTSAGSSTAPKQTGPSQFGQGQPGQGQPNAPGQASQNSTGPEITQDYLQRLAVAGDSAKLTALLANNGQCSPG